MKRSLFVVAAAAFATLFSTGAKVEAAPRSGYSTTRVAPVQYTKTAAPVYYKTVAPGGHTFYTRSYRGWTSYSWYPRYRCYLYYSPEYQTWFYWYAPWNRFLPIAYMVQYPPVNPGVVIGPPGPIALPGGVTAVPGTTGVPNLPAGPGAGPTLPMGAGGVPNLPAGATTVPNPQTTVTPPQTPDELPPMTP